MSDQGTVGAAGAASRPEEPSPGPDDAGRSTGTADDPGSPSSPIDSDETRPRGLRSTDSAQSTLVEGSSFCLSGQRGDIGDAPAEGFFVRDTRVLSRWQLLVDGSPLEALATLPQEPYECLFVGRAPTRPGRLEPTVVVERHRLVASGMREDLTVHNFGPEAVGLDLTLSVDSDFADLFEVKENRAPASARRVERRVEGSSLVLWYDNGMTQRGVRVTARGAHAVPGALVMRAVVAPQSSWSTTVEALTSVQGHEQEPDFPIDRPLEAAPPARKMRGWREDTATFSVENTVLAHALDVSRRDLGALRITYPDHPEDEVVAAGAPWFMTLFGRDSLLTSWMTLPFAPRLAMGTLRTLARLQGRSVDPMSEEQPGKILHELRLGTDPSQALGGASVYYGSIDSTPLFVMVAGRLLRWGIPAAELSSLRGPVEAALRWIDEYGDRDGDGFVEYQRSTDRGLLNQGWKDSGDSVVMPDGRLARAPIALAEVQGYCHAAFLAGADLEETWGDADAAARLRDRAARLRADFHRAFWDESTGFLAMALDGDKNRVASVTSNIGHCLWTGIVDDSVVDRVVGRLMAPDMFSGFGIRTLSADSCAFNPASYHCGSVWPHDTVICAAGMAACGHREEALSVVRGLLDAVEAFDGRLPELFCGFARSELATPVPYPTSCSPQAWAAATPYEMLRLAIGLDVDVPRGVVDVAPTPRSVGDVLVRRLPVDGGQVRIEAGPARAEVHGLGSGLRVRGHEA